MFGVGVEFNSLGSMVKVRVKVIELGVGCAVTQSRPQSCGCAWSEGIGA